MDRPPGVEFHTFTIIGRCERTGMFGIGTATRSLAVGARVPHVRSQTGAVAIMAIADPRLGTAALQFLEQGYKAPKVIEALVAMDPYAEYRQLGVIDDDTLKQQWEKYCKSDDRNPEHYRFGAFVEFLAKKEHFTDTDIQKILGLDEDTALGGDLRDQESGRRMTSSCMKRFWRQRMQPLRTSNG